MSIYDVKPDDNVELRLIRNILRTEQNNHDDAQEKHKYFVRKWRRYFTIYKMGATHPDFENDCRTEKM